MDTANSIEMIRLHMFISHIPRFPAAENRGIVETPAVLSQYRPISTRAFPTFQAPESGFILIHCRSPPALRSDATAQRGNRQSCSLFASGIRHPAPPLRKRNTAAPEEEPPEIQTKDCRSNPGFPPQSHACGRLRRHSSTRIRFTISMAASAQSAPLLPALVPARSIACSMVSVVSTPNSTGTPLSSDTAAIPLETSAHT